MKSTFLLATLLLASTHHAAEIKGTVVAVADGDTITVLTPAKKQDKIRLLGTDAPEKAQAFGQLYVQPEALGLKAPVNLH